MKRERGFTLIELTVAIVMIGVLIGVALPDIGRMVSRYRLDSAARRLAGDIRDVQQLSITREYAFGIEFYGAETGDDASDDYYRKDEEDGSTTVVNLPNGIAYTEGEVVLDNDGDAVGELKFNTRGQPNPGVGHVIIHNRWEQREISITPISGRVRVKK